MVELDRLTVRHWFKWLDYLILGACAIPLALIFAVFMFFGSPLIGLGIGVGVAVSLFLFLYNLTFAIRCPHCKKLIDVSTPWLCGYNGCKNQNVFKYPFVTECEHCHNEPKAYKCHHLDCQKLIFLSKDEQTINFAQCLNMPTPVRAQPKQVKKDKHADEIAQIQKSIDLKQKQVKEAELDVNLKNFKQTLEGPKMRNLEDTYRSKVKNEDDARRLHAAIDAEFANDPVERNKRHTMVNEIMIDLL